VRIAVVDASVAVKWVVKQELTERAYTALAKFQLIAPQMIIAEMANALWKYARAGQVDPRTFPEILDGIESRYFKTEPIDEQLTRAALNLAVELDHPVYDCYYLAIAKRESAPVITDDRRLLRRAAEAGFVTIDLARSAELDIAETP
jgi:predicted nucleic acid-binding protein